MPTSMPIPLLVLLLYVLWTIAVVIFAVGIARLRRVRHGEKFCDFPGGVAEGPPFHARAIRAHLNCVENLPIYGSVALAAAVLHIGGLTLDILAVTVLVARIAQTGIHLALPQSEPVVRLRGSLFGIQVIAVSIMAILLLIRAWPL